MGTFLGTGTSCLLLSAWQAVFGVAAIFKLAPQWKATAALPQAGRALEVYGLQWLGMAFITQVASKELPSSKLAVHVMAANLLSCLGFSIAAGPKRLSEASDNDMKLVPTNSFMVALAAASLIKTVTSKK